MPNGEHTDTRKTWERVKDLEKELSDERTENTEVIAENKKLKEDNESLLRAIELLKREE